MSLRQWQFIVLMTAFAILGLMPSSGTADVIPRGDLVAHLFGWIAGAISGRFAFPRMNALLLGLVLWGYSLLIETAQVAVPGRYFELLDLVANGAGVALGLAVMKVISKRGRTGG